MPDGNIRVCVLLHPEASIEAGDVVRGIAPQFYLDDMHKAAAAWACKEPIVSVYAAQAVFEKLQRDGFQLRWHTLGPDRC